MAKTHCKNGHLLSDDNIYPYINKKNGKIIKECKTCSLAENRARKAQSRANHLKRKFNISLEEYDLMLKSQDGKCAICGASEPRGMGNFHVDHCHKTGKIRKLLCMECNRGLACVKDDPKILQNMIDYLNKY